MNCPACKTLSLTTKILEENLKVRHCSNCAGHWLSAQDYWQWLEKHGETLPEKASTDLPLQVTDQPEVKFCIDCRGLMLKYRVGHGTNFYLDRCSKCGGVWFDRNEWESLRQRNLHDEIHQIFSDAWQRQIRQGELKRVVENAYRTTLGDEDYTQAMQIKDWITHHPQAQAIMSLLNQATP